MGGISDNFGILEIATPPKLLPPEELEPPPPPEDCF
jgi:hypothetical protein